MFELVLEKFEAYIDKMEIEKCESFNMYLAQETKKRIEQLEYLHKAVTEKHSRFMQLNFEKHIWLDPVIERAKQQGVGSITIQKSDEDREMDALMFEIELFTESFYYLAARMRTLIRDHSNPLPGLRSFECAGARNVRNKLIEHVEGKDSRVFLQSFGLGGEEGPRLKAKRDEGQEGIFPDAGLWANAAEIKNDLERLLDQVLAEGGRAD